METPLISVLLPVFKHESYLMDAVQSIIFQTYPNWEMWILNDNPKHDLVAYETLDKRIKVIDCDKHIGKWYRINNGLELAKGKYIAFQDADDVSIPQRFDLSYQYIGQSDFLYGDSICSLPGCFKTYSKCQPLDITNKPLGNQGSYFIRKDKIVRYPEIGRGDDWVFVAKCVEAGLTFQYLPLPLYYYRDYTGNFRSNSNKIKRWFSNRKLKKIVTKITEY